MNFSKEVVSAYLAYECWPHLSYGERSEITGIKLIEDSIYYKYVEHGDTIYKIDLLNLIGFVFMSSKGYLE